MGDGGWISCPVYVVYCSYCYIAAVHTVLLYVVGPASLLHIEMLWCGSPLCCWLCGMYHVRMCAWMDGWMDEWMDVLFSQSLLVAGCLLLEDVSDRFSLART